MLPHYQVVLISGFFAGMFGISGAIGSLFSSAFNLPIYG